MKPFPVSRLWMGVMLCWGLSAVSTLRAANDAAIWALWNQHVNAADQHKDVLEACRQYMQQHARDPLAPVARHLAAWHLFKQGQTTVAVETMQPMLVRGNTAMHLAANRLGRGWLSRVDREQVQEALQAYYRQEVRYPDKLESLKTHEQANSFPGYPVQDRWGKAWAYRATSFKGVPGFTGQAYSLRIAGLQSPSELTEALEIPYGAQCSLQPRRVLSVGGQPRVEFSRGEGERVVLAVGERDGAETLAYLSRNILIVCDENHWVLFRTP